MTTLEQLVAIVDGDQPYSLTDDDPLVALSHLHAVAHARAWALGTLAVRDIELATRAVLRAVDLAVDYGQPARELPAVFVDSDGDVVLGVQGHEDAASEAASAVACRDLLRDGTLIEARHATDDIERVRDFLDAAIRARRARDAERDRVRAQHAAAIDALRAAGWTVREP